MPTKEAIKPKERTSPKKSKKHARAFRTRTGVEGASLPDAFGKGVGFSALQVRVSGFKDVGFKGPGMGVRA